MGTRQRRQFHMVPLRKLGHTPVGRWLFTTPKVLRRQGENRDASFRHCAVQNRGAHSLGNSSTKCGRFHVPHTRTVNDVVRTAEWQLVKDLLRPVPVLLRVGRSARRTRAKRADTFTLYSSADASQQSSTIGVTEAPLADKPS